MPWRLSTWLLALLLCLLAPAALAQPTAAVPTLNGPVNDFAGVIDAQSAATLDAMIRELQAATGDAVVVATVTTLEPYADIRDLAVKMFENGGRGIGERGKDNGLLILLAPSARRVYIEVGYGLEPWITDGYAGDVSRAMTTAFREGSYGTGLVAGTSRLIGRIAEGRGVTLTGVRPAAQRQPRGTQGSVTTLLIVIAIVILLSRMGGGPGSRNVRRWGGNGWSGWSSGVGPFGGSGGRGGWSGGGSFGGGFGGFGGGRSGGGGGGAGW